MLYLLPLGAVVLAQGCQVTLPVGILEDHVYDNP